MPPIINIQGNFFLEYAGVPLVIDAAKMVRMAGPKSEHPTPTDKQQQAPEKYQPLADLVDEIDRLIPFRYLNSFGLPPVYPGRTLGAIAYNSQIGPMPDPNVRIGDWYYPNDAMRWSVFRGLATSAAVKAMLAATGGKAPKELHMRAVPFDKSAASYDLTSKMFMLPPRPLAEHGGVYEGLYLITLVDERYWWQQVPISLMRTNANTRNDTWETLIQQIASVLNISITSDPVSSVYSVPELDSHLWTSMENVAILFDAVAHNIGRAVVRNLNGTYSLLTAAQQQSTIDGNRVNLGWPTVGRIAGGGMFDQPTLLPVGDLRNSRHSVIPDLVRVVFPRYVVGDDPVPHFLNPRYQNQRPSAWYEESWGDWYQVDVPAASVVPEVGISASGIGVSGYTHTIHTTAKALFRDEHEAMLSGQPPLNDSSLRGLATALATDYCKGQVVTSLDEVIPGTFNWAPDGVHDIIWTYSARQRIASTRIMRTQWNQMVREMQHATPATLPTLTTSGMTASGVFATTSVVRGVGGPSVAQSIRDSFGASGTFSGGGMSGSVSTRLASPIISGDTYAVFRSVDGFPTNNRWRSEVTTQVGDGGSSGILLGIEYGPERILFEGTSGGLTTPGGFSVDFAYRGIDGTRVQDHQADNIVNQVIPDTAYGVNLTTYEKGQFAYPQEWTSGGIQGVNIVPQLQVVMVLDSSGMVLDSSGGFGPIYHSGLIHHFDPTRMSGPWISGDSYVWVTDKNCGLYAGSGALVQTSGKFLSGSLLSGQRATSLLSGLRYDGQFVGHSQSASGLVKTAQIYAVQSIGTPESFTAKLTGKTYAAGSYTRYDWIYVKDTDQPTPLVWVSGNAGLNPAYDENNVDHPFPIIVRLRKGQGEYYLIDSRPRWDYFLKTSTSANSSGYYTGFLMRYNQATKTWQAEEAALGIDATA